ncbi:MAG: ATP-binding protein [Janthinobacterium lividum]
MKHFLLVLLVLWGTTRCLAQTPVTAALRINRLPPTGLLLQKGWRYQAGDNPAWARPNFDDSGWDTLNPARPRRALPPRLSAGISWLRLRFQLGDSLRQRAPVLLANYLGAAEIYINGKLVRRDGVLSPRSIEVQSTSLLLEPLELPTDVAAEGVLAVRFAPYQPRLQRGEEDMPFFALTLQMERQLRQQQGEKLPGLVAYYVTGGVFLLLALLHLAFFRYNPVQRANRYFARYTLALALASLALYYLETLISPAMGGWAQWSRPTFCLLVVLSGLYAVRALYALFDFRPGRLYAGLWLSAGGVLVVEVVWRYTGSLSFFAFLIFMLAATAEQLRLTGRALRQHQRGARIIATGFAIALLSVLLLIGTIAANVEGKFLLNCLSFTLLFLPPALGISLYLAREFALDSQLLQVKLGEVERLSAQTIAQEQEKQTLLARQNETLETQVAERTGELQRSLTDLRATQAQLIQKEKMASLGELTAGIAHEIQNPLNFVNNFADVSAELVQELKEAQAAGDTTEVVTLADDLTQNLGKIHQHGQRAAGIVRGMLEHSRASTGERQPTDLNALADEYLRLAYHGLRAKDKTFNATLATDFAPRLPLVAAVSQDLGRVLLNLFSNAFYAVQQRQRAGEPGYAPTVRVSTKQVGDQVEVQVSDNGTGISPEVRAKIFQPFFTTKPSGEGTGLGLSLSYDIITQGHGGTFDVASQVGQGTTFTIRLPR